MRRAIEHRPRGDVMLTYEEQLNRDPRWALSEGSRHFENQSAVQKALRNVTQRLDELGIPYAVAGGMALFQHGYRRFTEDVDLLVTKDDLKAIHKKLRGRGYLPSFTGSKNLRDTDLGVRIEFIITGQFPGDGKPKPISFPDPNDVSVQLAGMRVLNLPSLIELKLASGLSSPERIKDLGDIQELIKALQLPAGLAQQLDPSVRGKYAELWSNAFGRQKRYVLLWRNTSQAAEQLKSMLADGVTLDPQNRTDDYAYLVTTDPEIAKKYDMHDESEMFGEFDSEDHEEN